MAKSVWMLLKKPCSRLHVFVFADRATGQAFSDYQIRRRSAPLAARDYTVLKKLWPRTLASYEVAGRSEQVLYPSRAPQSWWKSLLVKPRRSSSARGG